MPEFLILLRPARPAMLTEGMTEWEERMVDEHFAYLQELERRGILALAGRTTDTGEKTFGIVVFKAEGEKEAQKIMEEDPAVRYGVMRPELFPYRIALFGRNLKI